MTPHETIEQYGRLVPFFVKRFRGFFTASSAYDQDDLMQVGYFQLLKAAQRFDPERGLQFTTYASYAITGGIMRYIRDNTAGIKLSRRLRLHERVGYVGSLNVVYDEYGHEIMDLVRGPDTFHESDFRCLLDSMLTDRERLVFQMNANGFTQREIASRIRVKQPHAGRILKKAQTRIAMALAGGDGDTGMGGVLARAHEG